MIPDFVKYLYRRPQHIVIQLLSKRWAHPLNVDCMHNVLILSPHPDDEVFGCGNLIKTLCQKGERCKVTLVILSKGEAISRLSSLTTEEVISERKRLTIQANTVLGLQVENIKWLDFPDGDIVNTSRGEIQKLVEIINEVTPDTIFYPHPFEGSPDHNAASAIISKLISDAGAAKYYYCVWIWHHMPFYKAFKLNYKNSFLLPVTGCEKKQAVDIYARATDGKGNYYSGKLPKMLLKAIGWNNELYFKS